MARLSSRAFTLIELLVVIAIIGILMALLFPAAGTVIDGARKAQAKQDVTQIANAILNYEADYGYLPDITSDRVDKKLIDILTADPAQETLNPMKKMYLEVAAAKKGKSGTNGSGSFVDPWALIENKDTTYHIKIDNQNDDQPYDNRLERVGTNSVKIMKKVAVWNDPKNDQGLTDQGKITRRAVNSWE